MLYLKSADGATKIIVLESANLDELRKGRPARTPDGSVLIAWTPDPVWLADKLMDATGDAAAVGRLIDEAAGRAEKPGPRPPHKTHEHRFAGGAT
jgi:hypothetical protein